MASQITHIPYGKKIKDKYLSGCEIDQAKFFVGNLFPDIRIFGDIDRKTSHPENPTPDGLRSLQNDFKKGMYVHSMVDIERDSILRRLGTYELMDINNLSSLAMKIIEDEFSYDLEPDWSLYIGYLDKIYPEEVALVPEKTVERWHHLLQDYFAQKPSWESTQALSLGIGADSPEELDQIKLEIVKIRDNAKIMEIIKNTYKELFNNKLNENNYFRHRKPIQI